MANAADYEFEYVIVETDYVTADLLIWRRYKMRAIGLVEALLDLNPHLAKHHRNGPFIPVGTQVRIPIDREVLKHWPGGATPVVLFGRG